MNKLYILSSLPFGQLRAKHLLMFAVACFLMFGSLFAGSISIGDISPTKTKIADYSYKTILKNGTEVATDTVKNNINKATNTLLDCGILTCDYKVEVNAKQALTFDADTLKGAWTGQGVSVQKIFYETTTSTTKEQCNSYIDGNTSKNITNCENITTTTTSENPDILAPFAKDEIRTYVIRFVKDNTINSNGQKKYNNQVVDIYHEIFGQERKDAGLWNSTGGSVIYDGLYTVVTFTANGTFNVTGTINATVLVVAGGGAGGNIAEGGGGGAGGLIYNTTYNATGNITVTIGAGGLPSTGCATYAIPGKNSSFGTLIAKGGGSGGSGACGGGTPLYSDGQNGGSGGGHGATAGALAGGNGTSGQGYNGGASSAGDGAGGGGGGAGGVGADGVAPEAGGNGGIGVNYTINGSTVCYAGGGGGSFYHAGGTLGTAICGGGNAVATGIADGTNGTGGGGGAGGTQASIQNVGSYGGSGIVIIRYLTYTASSTGNLTVNYTTGGTATVNGAAYNDTFTPPANLTINATASAGYSFANWTENCNGTVNNATNPNTYITVNDAVACFVQANFAEGAPVIQSSAILPAQVHQNDNMLGYCNATTAATSVTYNFTWYKNGAVDTTGSVGAFTQGVIRNVGNISSASTAIGQTWILQCLAYNAKGVSAALNSSTTTILNTTANITAITIAPASPTVVSNLSCTVTVVDIEHATTNITGNWSKNGAVLLAFTYNGVANNTATIVANLTSGNFSKNDNISCTARAFDGAYYSIPATSANKTILNSAPSSPTVNSFVNATIGHWFTVNGSVTDANGGSDIATVTITPSLGTCVQMSNSTSGTSFFVKYNCTSTTPGTANIMIGFTDKSSAYANNSSTNAYPDHAASLTATTITPATIYTVTTVTCNMGVFSDIDSDTENVSARVYAWQYNGVVAAGQTASTFNLLAYGANNSANVSCSIRATNSTWASSNATTFSANKTITPNYAPQITVQNTFTNSTSGHSFTVFAGATDTDGGDSIAFTNITSTFGTCVYVSNTTSGGAMNVTYLCTGTSSGSSAITVRFTDTITGAYNTTNSSSNAYPDHAPTLTAPTITPSPAHLNDTLTCNPGVFSDVDGDTENVSARIWAWYVNGVYTAATATLPSGAFATYDNITCTENATNSSWTLTALASSAVFSNILGFYYTSYGNTSGVVGIGAAFDYSASVMNTATGNADAFGLLIMATVFIGFYIIGSRYTQERALVYATFVTTVVAFLLVSGNFLSPNWLILSIIALLAAIYFANRVG